MTANRKYKTKEFMEIRYPEFIAYTKHLVKDCDCHKKWCQDLWCLEAKNYEDAVKELKFLVLNKFEADIEELALLKVSDSDFLPVKDWYDEKGE